MSYIHFVGETIYNALRKTPTKAQIGAMPRPTTDHPEDTRNVREAAQKAKINDQNNE